MNEHKIRLQMARKLIEIGWCQGEARLDSPEGMKHCLLGAIDSACDIYDAIDAPAFMRSTALTAAVCEYVRDHLPNDDKSYYRSIVFFNDAKGRTKEDVLAVLDKAIASIPDGE